MSFLFSKFIKGLRISKEDSVNPSNIDIVPGGSAGTTITLQGSQTANQTVTLPNETGTILTTASTIDLDQLEALTSQKAVATNSAGHLVSATTSTAELNYLVGTTSAVQTQLNTLTTNLSTETTNRTNADALKANLSLNNIVPTAAVDVNGQKIINAGTPTNPADLTTKAYVDAAASGGGANLTLSNLISPIGINVDIIPNVTNTKNMGNGFKFWLGGFFTSVFTGTIGTAAQITAIDVDNNKLKTNTTTKLDWSGTNLDINTRKIVNVVDPTSAQDVATKSYVDSHVPVVNPTMIAKQGGSGFTLNSTTVTMPFANLLRNDMPSSYNNTTSIFTPPYLGKYSVNATFQAAGTLGVTDYIVIYLVDTTFDAIRAQQIIWGTGGNNTYQIRLNEVVDLASTLSYKITASTSGSLFVYNSGPMYFTITYLGA